MRLSPGCLHAAVILATPSQHKKNRYQTINSLLVAFASATRPSSSAWLRSSLLTNAGQLPGCICFQVAPAYLTLSHTMLDTVLMPVCTCMLQEPRPTTASDGDPASSSTTGLSHAPYAGAAGAAGGGIPQSHVAVAGLLAAQDHHLATPNASLAGGPPVVQVHMVLSL
jgi:hypothetical protein